MLFGLLVLITILNLFQKSKIFEYALTGKPILAGVLGYSKNFIHKKNIRNFELTGTMLQKRVYESLGVINLLRYQNLSSHNMKTFEIPSMNGLLITQKSREQNFFFPDKKASLMFKSSEELKKILKKIENSEIYYDQIKKNGYNLSKFYTYKSNAKIILNTFYEI
jgi:spore maturation protein CgeB